MSPTHSDPPGSDMSNRTHNTQDRRLGRSWVAITYDESSGEFSEESSLNMKPHRTEILQEARARFQELIKNDMLRSKAGGNASASSSQSKMARHGDEGGGATDFEEGVKRSRSATVQLEITGERGRRPRKAGRPMNRRSLRAGQSVSLNTSFSSQVGKDEIPGEKMISYPIGDNEKWEKWMVSALCALQQLGCRTMAKEWIKAIHPKKQSTNPYNGKNPETKQQGDPNDIKPVYWPNDVQHKEPDHIHKEERLKLLLHLIMKTPHKVQSPANEPQTVKEIGAQELMGALQGKLESSKYGLHAKKSILQKMIEVRTYLEQYEEGGLSADAQLSVPDYSCPRRNKKKNNDSDDEDDLMEDPLEVIPGYGEYDEEDVSVPAPEGMDPSSSGTEVAALPQAPRERSEESRGRARARKRAKRAIARSNTESMPGGTYPPWDPSRPPQEYSMQVAQMPGYDGLAHHPVDHNGIAIAQQMQQLQHHQQMSWEAMNGAVPYEAQFHDPNLADPRVVATMSVDPAQFAGREYAMMPPPGQQFCGGPPPPPHPHSQQHPFFQASPGGSMQFPYDTSTMQGFDQTAYFPPTTRSAGRPPM